MDNIHEMDNPHERSHAAVTESLALWLSGKKGVRAEAQDRFKSTTRKHLEKFHGCVLSAHDTSPYDLLRLHEGYHEDDDLQ